MGRDNKKSIIIEFNGLPGSGKSTICREMLEIPELFNRSLCTTFSYSPIDKYLKTVWLNYNCIRFFFAARGYLNNYPNDDNKSRRNDLLLMYFFRMYLSFLKHENSKILIIDQGLVQGLLSVPYNGLLVETKSIDSIIDFLQNNRVSFFRINCKSDVQLSKDRIHSRPTNLSRLDLMDESIVASTLQVQSDNLSLIRESFRRNPFFKDLEINIDTMLPPKENVAIISNYLRGLCF